MDIEKLAQLKLQWMENIRQASNDKNWPFQRDYLEVATETLKEIRKIEAAGHPHQTRWNGGLYSSAY